MTVEEANKEFMDHGWKPEERQSGLRGRDSWLCQVRVRPETLPGYAPGEVGCAIYAEGEFCGRVTLSGDYAEDVSAIAKKMAKYRDEEEFGASERILSNMDRDEYLDIYSLLEDVCKRVSTIRAIGIEAEALEREAEKARKEMK